MTYVLRVRSTLRYERFAIQALKAVVGTHTPMLGHRTPFAAPHPRVIFLPLLDDRITMVVSMCSKLTEFIRCYFTVVVLFYLSFQHTFFFSF